MRRSFVSILAIAVLGAVLLAACGGGAPASTLPDVPAEYAGTTNPFGTQADAVAAGEALYAERCASCHGPEGAGDGPAAGGLDPKPANLQTELADLPDDYVFWRIMDGGAMAPFNSSMPAQKGILTDDQVWQIVSYLRTLAQ